MQKITPCLWFDNQAEEVVNFYTTVFKDLKILEISRYDEEASKVSGKPVGSVMTLTFQLFGQDFIALNGGTEFTFSEATSFVVNCDNQDEVDNYWDRLSEGGEEMQCGWLKDKFGVTWQITPTILNEMLKDPDPEKSKRAMAAMLTMYKIDIKALKDAYNQE